MIDQVTFGASGTASASGLSRFNRFRGLIVTRQGIAWQCPERGASSVPVPVPVRNRCGRPVCGSTDGPAHCADAGNLACPPQVFRAALLGHLYCPVRPWSAQPADRRYLRSRRSRAACNDSRSHSRQRCGRVRPFPPLLRGHWSNATLTPCRATAFAAKPRRRPSQ